MNLRYRTWLCLLASGMILGASAAPANVALQYHCAGGSELAGDARLTTLHKLLGLPSTTNCENLALTRFSRLLTNSLRLANNPSSASLLEPLLSDVFQTESLGSFGGASANAAGFILALRLEPARAQLWQDSFPKISGGGGEKIASQGFTGWRWNRGGSNSLWIIPARDWLVAGCGDDFSSLQVEYLNQIRAQGRPVPALDHDWLEADIASARMGGWFRLLKPARLKLTVTLGEDHLQIGVRVLAEEALPWKSAPWQIPTNLLRGQIISFTTGQDVAALLKVNPLLAHLSSNPLTNQFYFWALDQMPLLNYMAWPAAHASNALERLAAEAPAALDAELKRFNGTELVWRPEARKLVWGNMRLFVPAVEAVEDKDGQFLFLSSFPSSPKNKPAPDALLAQIEGRTDLVYYDWELTGRRLQEWQILSKMVSNRAHGQNREAEDDTFMENDWAGALSPSTASTVTEITRVAPNELFAMRRAPVGFTAVELVLLADWFCDANSGPIHSATPVENTVPLPGHP